MLAASARGKEHGSRRANSDGRVGGQHRAAFIDIVGKGCSVNRQSSGADNANNDKVFWSLRHGLSLFTTSVLSHVLCDVTMPSRRVIE